MIYAFFVFEILFMIIFGCFLFLPRHYRERKKYETLDNFINKLFSSDFEEFEDSLIFNFIDSLHFEDREKALSTKYKLLYKDLCRQFRKEKK